jgi:hypothetical protein
VICYLFTEQHATVLHKLLARLPGIQIFIAFTPQSLEPEHFSQYSDYGVIDRVSVPGSAHFFS